VTKLLSELLAVVEHQTVVPNGNAAPRPTESVVPAAPKLQGDDTGMATISLRLDTWLLARIDAEAKRLGITRTAWPHIAASERLEGRR
jgi:hypothetical protein